MNSTHRIREGTHCSISEPAAPLPSWMLHRRRVRTSAMCPWVKKELAADSGANMGQRSGYSLLFPCYILVAVSILPGTPHCSSSLPSIGYLVTSFFFF